MTLKHWRRGGWRWTQQQVVIHPCGLRWYQFLAVEMAIGKHVA
jgi:hypothetical protein